jgi:tetratricopeptide (TPR) repeat protein
MGLKLRAHGRREASVGLLEEALRWAEATPGVQPFYLAEVEYFLGHFEEALQILEGLANEDPSASHLGYLALTLDGLGRVAEADSVMARVEQEFPTGRYPALLAARRRDVREAVTDLQACFDAGTVDFEVHLQIHRDPELEPVRDDPLFQALMRPSG